MDMIAIKNAVIRRMKTETQAELAYTAEQVGVGFGTLLKIRNGFTTDPRISTVAKLARYYKVRATDCEDCAA